MQRDKPSPTEEPVTSIKKNFSVHPKNEDAFSNHRFARHPGPERLRHAPPGKNESPHRVATIARNPQSGGSFRPKPGFSACDRMQNAWRFTRQDHPSPITRTASETVSAKFVPSPERKRREQPRAQRATLTKAPVVRPGKKNERQRDHVATARSSARRQRTAPVNRNEPENTPHGAIRQIRGTRQCGFTTIENSYFSRINSRLTPFLPRAKFVLNPPIPIIKRLEDFQICPA